MARLMTVGSERTKSSAVSVSIFPGLGRRESAPSLPSGLPVLKKNGSAAAGRLVSSPIESAAADAVAMQVFIESSQYFFGFPTAHGAGQRTGCASPGIVKSSLYFLVHWSRGRAVRSEPVTRID